MVNRIFDKRGLVATGYGFFLFDCGDDLVGGEGGGIIERQLEPGFGDEVVGEVGVGAGGECQVVFLGEGFGGLVTCKYRGVEDFDAVDLAKVVFEVFFEAAPSAKGVGHDCQATLAVDLFDRVIGAKMFGDQFFDI